MKSYLKYFKSIGLLFWVSLMLFSCSKELPKISRITSKENLPTLAIDNFKTSFTENAKISAKLSAKRVEHFDGGPEPYMVFPNGVSIVFFDNQERIKSSMTANYAIYYTKKESWEAKGKVVYSNIEGDILKTEQLFGDQKANKIFTDKFVEITKANGSIIKGHSGFESNIDFTAYRFIDVTGTVIVHQEFGEPATNNSANSKHTEK